MFVNKRINPEEASIRKIICLQCRKELEFIGELKDAYNSDFYISRYECKDCKYLIEIITQELRD